MSTSAEINGNTAPGTSSGQAIAIMEALAKKDLPGRMDFEWTELTLQEIRAGNTAVYVFALGPKQANATGRYRLEIVAGGMHRGSGPIEGGRVVSDFTCFIEF